MRGHPGIHTIATPRGAGAEALGPGDLSELLAAFNEVTARLESTQDRLRNEVRRLRSELSEANEQLQRSRRLAALGEMAAGISHEIRNPLGSIGLYARMLCEDLADRPGELGIARRIGEAVRGLDAIVSDVLSFAREVRVRPRAVTARELFVEAVSSCADLVSGAGLAGAGRGRGESASSRGPSAWWGEGEGLDEPFEGDRGLLIQALINVVRNAAEAMEGEPGRITLSGSLGGDPSVEPGGRRWVRLSVSDEGPGIPEDVRERMFNPFFTTRSAGTGLGLAIVHRIVDAHAGHVVVRNRGVEGGRGAVVELWLPPVPPSEASTTLAAPAREHMKVRGMCR